jgi:hypothetical protein
VGCHKPFQESSTAESMFRRGKLEHNKNWSTWRNPSPSGQVKSVVVPPRIGITHMFATRKRALVIEQVKTQLGNSHSGRTLCSKLTSIWSSKRSCCEACIFIRSLLRLNKIGCIGIQPEEVRRVQEEVSLFICKRRKTSPDTRT